MANTPLHIPTLINRNKWNDYRDEIWGDSYNWSWNRRPDEVQYLVIHHTVTKHEATPDDIALLHKARGWSGIGYHFVITKDGIVYYVGDVGTARANVLNKNEKVIGITMVGDFTKHNPSDDQIISAHDLCRYFLDNTAVWSNLKDWETSVVGHKELQATACPGTYWKGVPDSIFERIKNRIPYSPQPNPEPPAEDSCDVFRSKIVSYLGIESDPASTPFEAARDVIKGFKSTATDYKNKLSEEMIKTATLQTEVNNLNDKIANLDGKCQREKILLEEDKKALDKKVSTLEGTLSDVEGRLREAQKTSGKRQTEINNLTEELRQCRDGVTVERTNFLKWILSLFKT